MKLILLETKLILEKSARKHGDGKGWMAGVALWILGSTDRESLLYLRALYSASSRCMTDNQGF